MKKTFCLYLILFLFLNMFTFAQNLKKTENLFSMVVIDRVSMSLITDNGRNVVATVLFIIVSLIMLKLWKRRSKIRQKKYEQVINSLKKGKIDYSTKTIENELPISYNKGGISDITEKKILQRLEIFEQSDAFLKKDILLSKLSGEFKTNPKYLSYIIKKYRSKNFSNYINSLKINYITHKLYNEPRYREYKISYLAEECGFASARVFITAFKKVYGITPFNFIQNLKD